MNRQETTNETTTLPPIADTGISIQDATTAIRLMEEGIKLQDQIDVGSKRLEEIKQELLEIQVANDAPGFRNGDIVFIASFVKGRRMLNRELLLENGCPPEVIQKSYKEGEASWRRQLKRID